MWSSRPLLTVVSGVRCFIRSCRFASKMSSSGKPSGKVYFQLLGPCGDDTAPVLFLFTDSARYVFNCSEGTQRLFTEYKVKFGKLENIFFTSLKWDHIGGLPGLAMTLRDIGKSRLGIHSPAGMSKILKASNPFLKHENVKFNCIEYSSEKDLPDFKDKELRIQPLLIKDRSLHNTENGLEHSKSVSIDNPQRVFSMKPVVRMDTICYIGKLSKLPGRFLPKKAIELGVPKGFLFGKLQRGSTVVLEDGREVKPEDVMEPSDNPPSFAIIDCPSAEHISSITNHSEFADYMTDGQARLTLMVHMMDRQLYQDANYQAWLKNFPDSTYHWLIDKKTMGRRDVVLKSQFDLCKQFNQIDSTLFPEIEYWKDKVSKDDIQKMKEKRKGETDGFNLSRFNFRPRQSQGFDHGSLIEQLEKEKEEENVESNVTKNNGNDGEPICNCNQGGAIENANLKCQDLSVDVKQLQEENVRITLSEGITDSNYDSTSKTHSETCEKIKGKQENTDLCTAENDSAHLHSWKRKYSCEDTTQQTLTLNTIDDREQSEEARKRTRLSDSNSDDNMSSLDISNDLYSIQKFPKAIFLGTGASLPSKYRNVTSILIQIEPGFNFFFDCGEGTYGQLLNHYGPQTTKILEDLKCVFISHLHADHHLGLIRLLENHTKLMEENSRLEPLLIIAPAPLHKWLNGYGKIAGRYKFKYLPCYTLTESYQDQSPCKDKVLPQLSKMDSVTCIRSKLEFYSKPYTSLIETVEVDHGTLAYGIKLTHTSGWTMTYSGDTMPSENLIKAGKDTTYLIHEATLEDELIEEAKEKHHSTLSQALDAATKMNAKYTILTHFSQRYPKLPVINDSFNNTVAIAFDHMEISQADFPRISTVLPKLAQLFEEVESDEVK